MVRIPKRQGERKLSRDSQDSWKQECAFYPSLMLEHQLLSRNSRHKEKFVEIYKKRLQLKAEGKKKEQAPYKIVLNGTFGASGDIYNKLFDPRQSHRTCMTGQIFLLDLMEQLENVCEIIACNTDSVYVSYEKENREKIIELCHDWERRTKMVLEYDDFPNCMMFQRDVNNYLIVPDGDLSGMKGKGAVVKTLNELDNDCAILNKAVKAFLAQGIEPAETIYTDDNLIDFQKIFVKSSAYNFVYVGAKVEEFKEINPETGRLKTYRRPTSLGTILTDKTFRVFASMNEVGTLYKSKELGKDLAKFAGAPDNCFVYNKSVKDLKVSDFPELDRQWYIDTTWDKIIQFYTDKKIKPESVEEIKNEIRQKRKELENG